MKYSTNGTTATRPMVRMLGRLVNSSARFRGTRFCAVGSCRSIAMAGEYGEPTRNASLADDGVRAHGLREALEAHLAAIGETETAAQLGHRCRDQRLFGLGM